MWLVLQVNQPRNRSTQFSWRISHISMLASLTKVEASRHHKVNNSHISESELFKISVSHSFMSECDFAFFESYISSHSKPIFTVGRWQQVLGVSCAFVLIKVYRDQSIATKSYTLAKIILISV